MPGSCMIEDAHQMCTQAHSVALMHEFGVQLSCMWVHHTGTLQKHQCTSDVQQTCHAADAHFGAACICSAACQGTKKMNYCVRYSAHTSGAACTCSVSYAVCSIYTSLYAVHQPCKADDVRAAHVLQVIAGAARHAEHTRLVQHCRIASAIWVRQHACTLQCMSRHNSRVCL